jgi:hypothetical protein
MPCSVRTLAILYHNEVSCVDSRSTQRFASFVYDLRLSFGRQGIPSVEAEVIQTGQVGTASLLLAKGILLERKPTDGELFSGL